MITHLIFWKVLTKFATDHLQFQYTVKCGLAMGIPHFISEILKHTNTHTHTHTQTHTQTHAPYHTLAQTLHKSWKKSKDVKKLYVCYWPCTLSITLWPHKRTNFEVVGLSFQYISLNYNWGVENIWWESKVLRKKFFCYIWCLATIHVTVHCQMARLINM